MSKVIADTLQGRAAGNEAPDFPKGATITGVCTATSFSGNITGNVTGNATGLTGTPSIVVQDIVGVGATFSGVLTYEDVTQIDSVGLITARSGVAYGTGIGATISSPATNILTLGTNSAERLRVTAAGSVGVGTDDPQELFSVSQGHIFVSNSTAPQIRISPDNSDASDNNRTLLGQATGTNQFVNGSVSGDSILRGNTTGALLFGIGTGEKARLTATGGVSLNNGELVERYASYTSSANFNGGQVNLDNGMVHYCNVNLSGANTVNLTSSVGINTAMADGDMISLTLITAVNAATAYINHVTVDHSTAPTEMWIGGSAPGSGDGGTSNVDIYAFTLLKNGSNSYVTIGNHIKTS